MPALPLDDAGPYVAAAYVIFLGLVLVYVAIMASKLARLERELHELHAEVARRDARRTGGDAGADPAGATGGSTVREPVSP